MTGRFLQAAILVVLLLWLGAGCSPSPLPEVRTTLEKLQREGADRLLAAEYRSVEETLSNAEKLQQEQNREEAERYLQLARLKARLLERNLAAEKTRLEEERKFREQAELELTAAEQLSLAKEKETEESRKQVEKVSLERERSLPAYHTVKRGETLPQIAAQRDIYNDASLWPLLYQANRDQIRDPSYIWPGQVLLIPRNVSRGEVAEARKYAKDRQIH
jgi:nucleoid-associated protein YgaU